MPLCTISFVPPTLEATRKGSIALSGELVEDYSKGKMYAVVNRQTGTIQRFSKNDVLTADIIQDDILIGISDSIVERTK